jgi:hypothetical protein
VVSRFVFTTQTDRQKLLSTTSGCCCWTERVEQEGRSLFRHLRCLIYKTLFPSITGANRLILVLCQSSHLEFSLLLFLISCALRKGTWRSCTLRDLSCEENTVCWENIWYTYHISSSPYYSEDIHTKITPWYHSKESWPKDNLDYNYDYLNLGSKYQNYH